ncbi:MAG: hypothetical protein INH37_25925 [Myxococcaceae bacterium]|nr:hypothetical protein [Myxococcaceae bacterium]
MPSAFTRPTTSRSAASPSGRSVAWPESNSTSAESWSWYAAPITPTASMSAPGYRPPHRFPLTSVRRRKRKKVSSGTLPARSTSRVPPSMRPSSTKAFPSTDSSMMVGSTSGPSSKT